jgi:hypothetical protein
MIKFFNCLKAFILPTIWITLSGCAIHLSPQIVGPETHVIIRATPDRTGPASIAVFDFSGPRKFEALRKGLAFFTHRKLVEQGFAQEVVLMEKPAWNESQAIEAARDQEIEWALWGKIEEYRYGGTMGISKVTLSLKLLDTSTGDPVWYLVGTMTGKGRESDDYVLVKLVNPGSPMPDDIAFSVLNDLIETILHNGSMGPMMPSSP